MDLFTKKRIARRIAQAREEAKLTQADLAALLGLTLRAFQYYESPSDPRPNLERLGTIAEATGKSLEWFLVGDPDELPPSPEELSSALDGIREELAEIRRLLSGRQSSGS